MVEKRRIVCRRRQQRREDKVQSLKETGRVVSELSQRQRSGQELAEILALLSQHSFGEMPVSPGRDE